MLITEREFGPFKFVNIYFAKDLSSAELPEYDVLTYHTYNNLGEVEGYEKNTVLTTVIDLSRDTDSIWNAIKRQHRRHIRRAEQNKTTVSLSTDYTKFHEIYKKFLQQNKYIDLFRLNVLPSQFMQKYGILFLAENQGEVIGGNLYFHNAQHALLVDSVYQSGENTPEHKKRSTDASCYLYWVAMQYFKDRGIRSFDLGEVSLGDTEVNSRMNGGEYFKRCFGGMVIPRYTYRQFNNRFNKLLYQSCNYFIEG